MSCLIFTGIILTIAKNISQERSVSSIYHLLVGSKNIQTIQDAYIFGIQNYYGVYKGLEKSRFDEKIQELTQLGLLIEKAEKTAGNSLLIQNRRTIGYQSTNRDCHYIISKA